MDVSESKDSAISSEDLDRAFIADEARGNLVPLGWEEFEFFTYGGESLNYARFPLDQFSTNAAFSFMLAKKIGKPE